MKTRQNYLVSLYIQNLNISISEPRQIITCTFFRYSVVVFGGSGVFNDPHSVVMNSSVFTEYPGVIDYFNRIPTGK